MNFVEDETPDDDRSSEAIAYGWVGRITTLSLGMVLPGLLGYGVDRLLGFRALFVLLGFALGIGIGVWQLVRLTSSTS